MVTHTASIAERDACFDVVERCVAELGRLDVLGNIAGISRADHVIDVSEADYRRMFAVNADGPFFLCQASLPHLLESSGNIVNIASNAGVMGTAYTVAYSMTKGAVVQLTRSLAMELQKTPVRVERDRAGGHPVEPHARVQHPRRDRHRPDDAVHGLPRDGRTGGHRVVVRASSRPRTAATCTAASSRATSG